MSNERPEIFSDVIAAIRQQAEKSMTAMGIPIIVGKVAGGSCCFVEIADFDFESHKSLFADGSICVIDVEESDAEEGQPCFMTAIQVSVRMGLTSTWMHSIFESPDSNDTELDDDDDCADDFESELESWELIALGLNIARIPSFGALKNKAQRFEFARSAIEGFEERHLSDFTIREIVSRAESYFTLGFLPLQAKELHASGKAIGEIAKSLGISKQKAERMISAEVPEFITEILNRSP